LFEKKFVGSCSIVTDIILHYNLYPFFARPKKGRKKDAPAIFPGGLSLARFGEAESWLCLQTLLLLFPSLRLPST
jgi:hypothetical protein